jgi:group I intron endonuclease
MKGINPITREQYYLELLKPEYNVLELAGSFLGFKHKTKTLEYFKNNREVSEETRKNLSLAATGRILTEETRKKLSEIRKDLKLSTETRTKISEAAKALRGVKVLVKNTDTKEELEFASLTDAAKAIGVSRTAVRKSIDIGRPIQKKYIVTLKSK